MIKMIGILKPLETKQKFYVYEDENKIGYFETELNKHFIEDIHTNVELYSVKSIDLTGPQQFSKGLAKQIHTAYIAKYSKDIEINVV